MDHKPSDQGESNAALSVPIPKKLWFVEMSNRRDVQNISRGKERIRLTYFIS
jgi:hypothetical protein